jgi:integrase
MVFIKLSDMSIKLKFRQSVIHDKAGMLYFMITTDRVVRQLKTGFKIYPNEWNEAKSLIVNGEDVVRNSYLSDVRQGVRREHDRLNHIVNDFDTRGTVYSADDIIDEYLRVIGECSLFNFMERAIAQLKGIGKVGTCINYQSTLNSFKRYRNDVDIMLDGITSNEMLLYEAWMLRQGICLNTTSFYMRILRAVYNRAVEMELVEQTFPFKHVYTGVSKTVKRAISINDIKRLRQLELPINSALSFARDIFLFSFYTRGMTFVDIAFLKHKDVRQGVISYRRQKTGQQLTIKVEKFAKEIMERYRSCDSEYIFPIIKGVGDEYRQYKNSLRLVNNKLKAIGRMMGTKIKLTTYVGRHSWGSAAKTSNIPISVISESMGHDSEMTTKIYLASLDTSVIDQANAKILSKL